MILLLLSISCSVAVSVLLKMARSRAIDVAQAIAVNYGVAIALCILLLRPDPMQLLTPATPWWVLVALGVLLPTVFIAMAAAVRHAGIVLSDAAQRLSLIIPLMAAFVVFGWDKFKAKYREKHPAARRVPERTLFLLALLGGSLGALLGMRVWRHKTLHRGFRIGIPLILAAQVLLGIGLWLYLRGA